VAQGTADGLVRPSVTEAYVDELCRRGSKVQFDLMQGVGHAFIARNAADRAIAWIAARFGAEPASQQLPTAMIEIVSRQRTLVLEQRPVSALLPRPISPLEQANH
jgi:Secretory lipase